MLVADKLSVVYPDGTQALNNVSFSVPKGQKIAILGGNGAGKTTLFYSIMGLLPIEKGIVSVDGTRVEKKSHQTIRKTVGFVFQNPEDQLFSLTVSEDIAFGLRSNKVVENTVVERVNHTVEQLGIQNLLDKNPCFLSGGEKRLVALGTVLAMEPEFILFDEPGAFLDPRSRKTLIAILQSLTQTLLIATHDLDLAWDVCEQVLVLHHGEVVFQGKPDELFFDEIKLQSFGLELPISLQKK